RSRPADFKPGWRPPMSESPIVVAITGGLVTFVSSIIKENWQANRRERALDIGARLTQFAVANYEAREKTGPITDEDKAAHKLELARIHDAVFADFKGREGLELQPRKISAAVLVMRFFAVLAITLLLASAYGAMISGLASNQEQKLLVFDLVVVGIVV